MYQFHKDLKNVKQTRLRTRSNMGFLDTQEQETPEWIVHTHSGQCLRRIAGGNVGLPLDTT